MKIGISNLISDLVESTVRSLNEKKEKIDPDTRVKYTTRTGKDGETSYKNALASDKDSPQYKAALALRDKDSKQDDEDKKSEKQKRDADAERVDSSDFEKLVGDEEPESDNTKDLDPEIQSRIDQNKERIQKFREARDKFATKGDDGMIEYEDYLVDQIENNEEIIGDALDEILDIEDAFDEKNPITSFTGQDYDGTGHRLSMISLAARYPDGNTSDFRVERMKKRCEEGDPKYKNDCENYSPNDTPTEKDIEAFKRLQKNQQQSLVDMGLVDEDGMVTVYRGAGGIEGEGSVDYKGSAVDSWSMSPTIAWSYAEINDGKNIMKAKVPLDRVIMAAASSTREQFEFPSEFEVTIDSIGLDNVESINYDSDKKKIMERKMTEKQNIKILKDKKGNLKLVKEDVEKIKVDINNDNDTDWLRRNREEQKEKSVEESINNVIDDLLIETEILSFLTEDDSYEDFIRKNKVKKGDDDVTIATALQYAYEKGQMSGPKKTAYSAALGKLGDAMASGKIDADDVPKSEKDLINQASKQKKQEPKVTATQSKDTSSDFADIGSGEDDKKDSKEKTGTDGKRIISGKDKTLKKIDTLDTEDFQREIEPDQESFDKKNKKFAIPEPPPPYKIPDSISSNAKFPRKYVAALERMINTKNSGDAQKWSHYSDLAGGAGQISAQAGELMAMMGSAMSDEEFNDFANSINSHIDEQVKNNKDLKTDGKRVVTKSWVKAAKGNREAILNRIKKDYPDSEVVAAAWDTKADVEALGLENYEDNKGFSTDMYLKVKTKDGEILDEVSLKKDVNVNFLNSGTGKFSEWDEDLDDSINPKVYTQKQRQQLVDAGKKLQAAIEKMIASGKNTKELEQFKKDMKSKKVDFAAALSDTASGKGSRAKSKIIQSGIAALASSGNKDAQAFLEKVQEDHKKYQAEAIDAVIQNKKIKDGMLSEIRSEFPLKAVGEGEETMAIGPYSLDRSTMENIFGTADFEKIKERLTAEPGSPPFLAYKAEVGDEVIPLAEIVVREDGVGYGGQFKFEMTLDKRFAEKLKSANEEVYSS